MEEDKPSVGLALYGNDKELKQLSNFLDSPNCHLQYREEEKRYYLVSSRFSNLASEQIHELAKKLLITIRAFAKIEKGWDFQSITIGRGKTIIEHNKPIAIVEEGKDSRSVNLTLPPINGGTFSAIPPTVIINGVVQTPSAAFSEREKRLSDDFLDPCEELDSKIYDVLSDFALPTSWSSLYRILRNIEKDFGKDVEEARWAEKGKRDRFNFSSSFYDSLEEPQDTDLGTDRGRHGKLDFQQKEQGRLEKMKLGRNVTPYPNIMDLSEAGTFISCIVKKWLSRKLLESKNASN